jgi:hypothetical protein
MKARPGAVRTQFVPVGAATLWTQTGGQGRPLVLRHGGPGMSDNLEPRPPGDASDPGLWEKRLWQTPQGARRQRACPRRGLAERLGDDQVA